ncbi:MAG: metalloregulator ArsR/SmtB family transcription factor [Bacteroidetes bacterium]|jgi:DNA-binding transcriptional ArsR family regulator|nr:metalloregulator ArsR/SmtB family transcription factor [Bacteroidota bacterium]
MKKQSCIRDVADLQQINSCIRKLHDVEPSIATLAGILKLAGSDARLKILYLLKDEPELCPCDLADILDMTVPAVSQHLRKLKDGGLLSSYRDGKQIFYVLREPYREILEPLFSNITKNKLMKIIAA